jgi:hypothetical protein
MEQLITYVGLDVHKDTIAVALGRVDGFNQHQTARETDNG